MEYAKKFGKKLANEIGSGLYYYGKMLDDHHNLLYPWDKAPTVDELAELGFDFNGALKENPYRSKKKENMRNVTMRNATMSTPSRKGKTFKVSSSKKKLASRIKSWSSPALKSVKMNSVKYRPKGIGTGILRGKFRRPTLKKLDKLSKFLKKGAVSKTEYSDTLQDEKCVYIGHTTFIQEEILKNFSRAVVKKLYNTGGVYFTAFGDQNFAITRLQVLYQPSITENIIATHEIDYTTPPFTYETMATALYSWLKASFLGTALATERARVIVGFRLYYGDVGAAGFSNIVAELKGNMQIEWYVRSILKVQNRTRSALGTQDDQVDRIPLIGRSYEVNRCGFQLATINSAGPNWAFTTDPDNGLIQLEANSSGQNIFKEPPMPSVFKNKVKHGGIKLGPGVIKYSTLNTHSTIDLTVFLQQVFATNPQDSFFNYGKTRMFAMEKPMNLDEENLINIGYEHQYEVGISIKLKRAQTQPVITV